MYKEFRLCNKLRRTFRIRTEMYVEKLLEKNEKKVYDIKSY